jgi:hypothetical protein
MSDSETEDSKTEESKSKGSESWASDFRVMEQGFAKAAKCMLEGATSGLQTWVDSVEKSSQDKDKGFVAGYTKGMAKAMVETVKVASGAPGEIMKAASNCDSIKRILD